MGTIYQITCRKCHHIFNVTRGPLMSGPQYVCTSCVKHLELPEFAPYDSPELDMHSLARLFVSSKWLTKGRPFSRDELAELRKLAIADGCSCGGEFVADDDENTHIEYRCKKCKTNQVDCEMIGLAD